MPVLWAKFKDGLQPVDQRRYYNNPPNKLPSHYWRNWVYHFEANNLNWHIARVFSIDLHKHHLVWNLVCISSSICYMNVIDCNTMYDNIITLYDIVWHCVTVIICWPAPCCYIYHVHFGVSGFHSCWTAFESDIFSVLFKSHCFKGNTHEIQPLWCGLTAGLFVENYFLSNDVIVLIVFLFHSTVQC